MKHYLSIFFMLVFSLGNAQEAVIPKEIEQLPPIAGGYWGAYLVDQDTREVLYSYNMDKLFIPASVTKLFTTVETLEALGADFTFATKLKCASAPERGKIKGNLYLVGGGDPALTSKELYALAQKIYDLGVRTIRGDIIVDDSLFGVEIPTHAEWEDLSMGYAPELTSLCINDNVVKLSIIPNEQGNEAQIRLVQDVPYCRLRSKVKVSKDAVAPEIQVTRALLSNDIEVTGVIPAKHPEHTVLVAIHNPHEYARQIFKKALKWKGIRVEEKKSVDAPLFELAQIASPPVSELIKKVNKDSHNLVAGMLFKHSGGSHAALFNKLKATPLSGALYDGSGLSRHNLLSPRLVVELLMYMEGHSQKNEFFDSLSVAGKDGTLLNRLVNKPAGLTVLAKTGGMSGLANEAGIAVTPSGRRVFFSIFINNSPTSWKETAAALDALLLQILPQ